MPNPGIVHFLVTLVLKCFVPKNTPVVVELHSNLRQRNAFEVIHNNTRQS
jgi:hypothetical protein